MTGIGVVSPVGRGAAALFEAVCAGRSGLVRPPRNHPGASWVDALGVAPDIDPATVLPPTMVRIADRFQVLALAAAADALRDAGLVVGSHVAPSRVAVVMSTGAGGTGIFEEQVLARQRGGRAAVSAYLQQGFLPNMAVARIAIAHGIRGFSSTISTACAAGAQAVAEALRLIREGTADAVVCGGAEAPLGPTSIASFANARALANGWPDPASACRPFDRRRNGFVLGEGAGVLVVERADTADARGAAGYADLVGWGASTDAYHPTRPRPDGSGCAEAVRAALARAALPPEEVGYVNAHGTGTKLGDLAEARALRSVFGAGSPAVSSTKPVTGHLLGATGAVEAAVTAMAVCAGVLPPTLNLDEPDLACDLDHVRTGPRRVTVQAAMSTSCAFGGHNLSLVFAPASTAAHRTVGSGPPAV